MRYSRARYVVGVISGYFKGIAEHGDAGLATGRDSPCSFVGRL